jgi:hypothetical protein
MLETPLELFTKAVIYIKHTKCTHYTIFGFDEKSVCNFDSCGWF